MPRGVYDRSKMKTKTASTAAAPAAAKKGPKAKPGRKPGAQAKTTASTPVVQSKGTGGNAFDLLSTVRENLATLTSVGSQFGNALVADEVAEQVKLLSSFREKIFGSTETIAKKEEKSEAASAPVSNGTSAAPQQYAQSVPMPPAPIPTVPAAH